jgi:hypothetical protein
MPNPEIQLKFDQKLDQEMAWEFYSSPEFGGCNFWAERALFHHPKLVEIESAKDKKTFLSQYISEFYNLNSKELKELNQKNSTNLHQSQEEFFKIVDKTFCHYPWPRNTFTGFFSIFDFCPRFLDSGSFQVFIYDDRDSQLFTIFHEMLHFIFYDFAQKTFIEKFKKLNTEKGIFWDLAEIFNAVIQNTDSFIKLHGKMKGAGYPNHNNLIIKGKILWARNQDLNQWIIEMMKIIYVKNKK